MAPRPGLTRDRLVAAATELIDREGLEALSLARLARRFGVKTPSLYNHVDGLAGLRDAVRLAGIETLGDALSRAALGRSGGTALRAVAHAYRAFAREHPGLYPLTLAPGAGAEEGAAAGRVVEVVTAVLRGYGLEGDGALHATRVLRSALHGFTDLERAGGFGLPLDVDASFEALLDALDHGLRTTLRGPDGSPVLG